MCREHLIEIVPEGVVFSALSSANKPARGGSGPGTDAVVVHHALKDHQGVLPIGRQHQILVELMILRLRQPQVGGPCIGSRDQIGTALRTGTLCGWLGELRNHVRFSLFWIQNVYGIECKSRLRLKAAHRAMLPEHNTTSKVEP